MKLNKYTGTNYASRFSDATQEETSGPAHLWFIRGDDYLKKAKTTTSQLLDAYRESLINAAS